MGLITNETIVLVHPSLGGGMQVETYPTKLDMVLALMNNGSVGGGICYGDDQHLEALNKIEAELAKAREAIAKDRALEDGWICSWCDTRLPATEKGYCHTDGVCYCSKECAEERDANI